ncbi:hypothetical protein MP638_006036 [Amoeboaphelidium occidentale]|nr:hypothetical protein MP638_006036 [Amoeboaphelidium occidentale]
MTLPECPDDVVIVKDDVDTVEQTKSSPSTTDFISKLLQIQFAISNDDLETAAKSIAEADVLLKTFEEEEITSQDRILFEKQKDLLNAKAQRQADMVQILCLSKQDGQIVDANTGANESEEIAIATVETAEGEHDHNEGANEQATNPKTVKKNKIKRETLMRWICVAFLTLLFMLLFGTGAFLAFHLKPIQ